MKKTLVTFTVAATIGLGSMVGGFAGKTEAASVSDLKQQQKQVQDKRASIDSSIKETDKKIANIKGQQVDVQTELKRLGSAIDNTTKGIQDKTAKIGETKAQIAKLQDEIKVIQERIKKRNELLKERARNYQENGGSVNYISVLMGAKSFGDLVELAGAVAQIMEADQTILNEARQDKLELETKQAQVQTDLTNLQKMLSDLEALKNKLDSQKTEQGKLLSQLQEQEKEATDDRMDMAEQDTILAAQASAIQQAIKNESARQAAAAEAARQQAAAAAAASSSSSSSNSGGESTSAAAPTPHVSSGNFTRPASGVVSSTYGARWGTFHYGVDIANRGSNVPIVAAADGVVVTAHFSSSYGNVVYIAHSINGHVYTTVYAHMNHYIVSTGQTVSKGQQIGVMGNTGDSTGQHLHFELYNGPWAYHSAINPMGIVPF